MLCSGFLSLFGRNLIRAPRDPRLSGLSGFDEESMLSILSCFSNSNINFNCYLHHSKKASFAQSTIERSC